MRQRWDNNIDGRLNKAAFTMAEQTKLIDFFDVKKWNWAKIAENLSSDGHKRTAIQCFRAYR